MLKNNKDIHIGQIFIELTNLCNFNCVFCPNERMTRERKHMEPELAKRLIDEIVNNSISEKIAFLLMGEPLLYPEIFNILEYATKRNVRVTFSTNGSLLYNSNIDRLLNIPLDIMQISLQTTSRESFELRRRNPNLTYDRYIDGIKALLKKVRAQGLKTKVSILLMDPRFSLPQLFWCGRNMLGIRFDFEETKKLVNALYETVKGMQKSYFSKKSFKRWIRDTIYGIKRFIFSSYKIRASKNIEFVWGGLHDWGNVMIDRAVLPAIFGSCNALTEQLAILSNGDYSLCCRDYNGELIIGNAHKHSLKEILISENVQKIKKDFRLCRLNFKKCRVCRGATNVPELILRQVFTSVVYNISFIEKFLKRLVVK